MNLYVRAVNLEGGKVRRLIALVVTVSVVLLLASGVAMAQATTETINIRSPESFTIDNPCPGYEEPIQVDGVFHHVGHVTQFEGNLFRFVGHTNTTNVTGIGLVTGDEYRFINSGGFAGGGTTAGGTNTLTDEVSYIIVSKGASPNFMLHAQLTLVFGDPNPSAFHEQLRTECTP
jgi:hypothetical protein